VSLPEGYALTAVGEEGCIELTSQFLKDLGSGSVECWSESKERKGCPRRL
jgi:hypothetical protein